MGPVVLTILDGWGIREEPTGNAVRQAATPNIDRLFATCPHTQLACSGEAVGLMPPQMGDSNVGHTNIGAGRIVYQPLVRINRAIRDGSFAANPVLERLWLAAEGRALHLMGLLSDGGVHSHQDHLLELLRLAKEQGLKDVYIHIFLDGRDVPPQSALTYVDTLEAALSCLGVGRIATVSGRVYAMDRDRRWERIELAYNAIVHGQGLQASSAREAVEQAYAQGLTDEFVRPTVVCSDGQVQAGDAVFMWNFRADRARELMHALLDEEFTGFARGPRVPIFFAAMAQYEEDFPVPHVLPPQDLRLTLGEVVSRAGLNQLRLAETEKYAHVTFIFNGGQEICFPGEDRILVPSPPVATYDLQPEMSANEITEQLLANLTKYDFIVVNYANLDMVGHTGNMAAAVQAVETVDSCIGRLVPALREGGGTLVLTADHGNAEQMLDPVTGEPHTAHTDNPGPCLVMADGVHALRGPGVLADIAPTVLQLLKVQQPPEMTGRSLLAGNESS
ncbi:MAG: 2,3-bisphosphoglycerate-independent phosphoglycerate mutase [Firmicutes bacterium]|nr:2,3-bisphosphoglycerate-independent phosphoglycerate mutase [Bacillota bacterium]